MKKKAAEPVSELFPPVPDMDHPDSGPDVPLALRMRPRNLDEVVGQDHLLGPGKLLRRTLQLDRWTSLIFYGPPGSGKTTLAQIISRATKARFVRVNAVTSNVSVLRSVMDQAVKLKQSQGRKTILFIDEIHRFNVAQQDVLMPDVESGNIVLIGATTHNPCFAINGPLLSRSLVFELRPLDERDLIRIVESAIRDEARGFGKLKIQIDPEALQHIAKSSAGDARRALNALEVGVLTTPQDPDGRIHFSAKVAEESCQRKIVYYDGTEDYHYDTASAFIKSMRGSDPDAAIYWLAKMLYAGEDPRFIIRRILIFSSEDIGNADPQAILLASAGMQAIEFVGMPEARIILGQLVTYMATAPKSKASYSAIESALEDIKTEKIEEVPDHLRDASYQGAERLQHGHHAPANSGYVPKSKKVSYYHPTDKGFEQEIRRRLKLT
ncbi:MAG: replication-associated recombination protein A [Candidatus Omnitrophica bacterium]|nr:replication-associated recombination protein A [Candidatus Omnitrophota bacterium]